MKNVWMLPAILLLFSCGKDGATNQSFIPNISNSFTSSRGTNFFFLNYTANVNTSSFEGNEQPGSLHFTGSYTNYDIVFTFDSGPEKGVTYTGKFVKDANPLQMNITGTNKVNLIITKQ